MSDPQRDDTAQVPGTAEAGAGNGARRPATPDAPAVGDAPVHSAEGAQAQGDARSPEGSSADTQAGDTQAGDTLAGDTQAGDTQAGGTQAGDTQAGDTQAGDTRAGEATDDLPEVEVVEDPVVVARRERDDYLDQLLRARAEFDNFRKRTARERLEALDRGAEQLVARMMGVLDNLGFALDAAEKSEDGQLAKGVQMVHAELMGVLVDAGLSEVPGKGAVFDPAVHEAVMQVEAPETGQDTGAGAGDEPVVVDVLRRGWMYKDRLLRPASVSVSS